MNPVLYLGAFLLALGVLVVVHEFGHFLAARWVGVKVLRFCVGFGQPIWSRRFSPDGTEWALAAFPLGGYVKMLDEREGEVSESDLPQAFNRQSLWKRSFIVVAGPLANLLLAIVLYFGLFLHGQDEMRPLVGDPPVASAAADAGFRNGDQLQVFDGSAVQSWQQLRWEVLRRTGRQDEVRVSGTSLDGAPFERSLDVSRLTADDPESDPLAQLGLHLYRPPLAPIVGQVARGGAAQKAGLEPGDRIQAVAGARVDDWHALVEVVQGVAGQDLPMTVLRAGREFEFHVVPVAEMVNGKEVGRIGVAAAPLPEEDKARFIVLVRYGPAEAIAKAVALTWETSAFSLRMMGRMVTGDVSWRNLSGPVTIADYAGQSARMGVVAYLKFLALISISLGVLNLLPIPLLDGGHLLYHTAEAIKGAPLSEKALELGQRLGLGVLGLLMLFALYNDISRLFSS